MANSNSVIISVFVFICFLFKSHPDELLPHVQLFENTIEQINNNAKHNFLETLERLSDGRKKPLMIPLYFPTNLKNRVYKESGIHFQFSVYLPGKLQHKRNITFRCEIFLLTNVISGNCSRCFEIRREQNLWKNREYCKQCLREARKNHCNNSKVSISFSTDIYDDSTSIVPLNAFLKTSELLKGNENSYYTMPGLNVFQIHKYSFDNCSTGKLVHSSTLESNKKKQVKIMTLMENEINNLVIACTAIEAIDDVRYASDPLVFKPSELITHERLSHVTFGTHKVKKFSLHHQGKDLHLRIRVQEYILRTVHFDSMTLLGVYVVAPFLVKFGKMPLVLDTQHGATMIKDKYKTVQTLFSSRDLQNSQYLPSVQIQTDKTKQAIIYRVGCFNWVHNKWFTIVSSNNKNNSQFKEDLDQSGTEQFLASFYGETGDQLWEQVMWTKLHHVDSNQSIASLKCDQLGNILVWSSFDTNNHIYVVKAHLHEEYGTLVDEPEILDQKLLCFCSNNSNVISTAIDVVYEDVNDPYSSKLAVVCGQTSICLTPLTANGSDIQDSDTLLELPISNGTITRFQLDQSNIYFLLNSSTALYSLPRSCAASPSISSDCLKKSVFNPSHVEETEKELTGGAEVYQVKPKVIWFDLYKDQWKLPAPSYHCMFPQLNHQKNTDLSMETKTSLRLRIHIRWIRSADCTWFGRPKLTFLIKYARISNESTTELYKEGAQFSEIKLNPKSSTVINDLITIRNLTPNAWYYFKIEIVLKDFLNTGIPYLWYSATPMPTAGFRKFTDYPSTTKTDRAIKFIILGVASVLVVILLVLIVISYYAWKGHRKWEISQKLLRLPKENIELLEKIGEGQFGDVHKATWSGKTVVVKTLKLEESETAELFFREEAIMVSKLDCSHIVNAIGICLQSRPIMLVFEYMNGGSLDKYLNNQTYQELLTAADLLYITKCALQACIYLENNGYVHRDIAARNCLLSLISEDNPKPKLLKLADFGLAKDVGTDSFYRSEREQIIPVISSAPESLNVPSVSNNKSDVWSFGVLLFETFSWASEPFGHCKLLETQHDVSCPMIAADRSVLSEKITRENCNLLSYPLPCVANFNQVLIEIMAMCWTSNPSDRPTFNLLNDLILQKSESISTIELKPMSRFYRSMRSDSADPDHTTSIITSETILLDWKRGKVHGVLKQTSQEENTEDETAV